MGTVKRENDGNGGIEKMTLRLSRIGEIVIKIVWTLENGDGDGIWRKIRIRIDSKKCVNQ